MASTAPDLTTLEPPEWTRSDEPVPYTQALAAMEARNAAIAAGEADAMVAGADVPLGQRFTLNAQANLGVLNDTDFGVTIGVGYNFGRLFR